MKLPRVLLVGYGKMGREIEALLSKHKMTLRYIMHRHTSFDEVPWKEIDIAIDFSSNDQILQRSTLLFEKNIPLVQGTTGWDATRADVLAVAEQKNTSIVWSNNFSLGMSLFKNIVSHTAGLLQHFNDFDIALMEAHHRKKKDAPSGTLLSLQEILLSANSEKKAGCSAKTPVLANNEIDTATLRVGHVPGYHSVWIDGPEENIQLIHSVRSRAVFADGALHAAELLLKNPGIWHFDALVSHEIHNNE